MIIIHRISHSLMEWDKTVCACYYADGSVFMSVFVYSLNITLKIEQQ